MDGSNSIMGTTKVESLSDSKVDDSLTIKLLVIQGGTTKMESLIGNRESEVRNQLLVHMYENATFDMDTTEQT